MRCSSSSTSAPRPELRGFPSRSAAGRSASRSTAWSCSFRDRACASAWSKANCAGCRRAADRARDRAHAPMPSTSSSRVARYLTGTIVLSTIIAAAITAFGNRHVGFGENFVYSQCIGTLTYISIDLPRRLLWPQGLPSFLPMIGLAILAAPIGWFGGSFIASLLLGNPWGPSTLELNAVLGFLALTAGAGIG